MPSIISTLLRHGCLRLPTGAPLATPLTDPPTFVCRSAVHLTQRADIVVRRRNLTHTHAHTHTRTHTQLPAPTLTNSNHRPKLFTDATQKLHNHHQPAAIITPLAAQGPTRLQRTSIALASTRLALRSIFRQRAARRLVELTISAANVAADGLLPLLILGRRFLIV